MSGLFALRCLSCLAFCLWNRLFYPQNFLLLSWETSADIFWGWQLKHVGRLVLCLGVSKPLSMRTGLALPYMLRIYVYSFSMSMSLFFFSISFFQKKKNMGRRCVILFFLLMAFQILHVFFPDISVHCAMIEYAYIWLRVYARYLLSFFVHLNDR
jgi:hypothetical protein